MHVDLLKMKWQIKSIDLHYIHMQHLPRTGMGERWSLRDRFTTIDVDGFRHALLVLKI